MLHFLSELYAGVTQRLKAMEGGLTKNIIPLQELAMHPSEANCKSVIKERHPSGPQDL